MLSKENIKKLNMNGLYKCNPNTKYRGKLFEDNLYHCCNWTFKVVENNGKYYMRDTYWSSGDSVCIYLTDENIDEFKLIFELDKVKQIKSHETAHYKDYYRVAIDSGGINYPKYFVDINITKDKDLIIKELDEKISEYKREIEHLQGRKARVISGEISLEWY